MLKSQHIENLKDPQSLHKIGMTRDFACFETKSNRVTCLLAALSIVYDARIINQLLLDDYDYPFTADTYLDDIDKVRAELASEGLAFAAFREQLLADNTADGQPAKETYYLTIMALQKHLGLCHGLSPMKAAKELTVCEFGFALKEYNKQIQASKTPLQNVND